MLTPLYKNEADIVLGQPSDTLINYQINPFKSLTGQRALFKKDIVPILNDIRNIRFGVQTTGILFDTFAAQIIFVVTGEVHNALRRNFNHSGRQRAHKLTVVGNKDQGVP